MVVRRSRADTGGGIRARRGGFRSCAPLRGFDLPALQMRRQALVQQAEPAFVQAKLVGSASSDAVEAAMLVDFPNGVKVRIGSAQPSDLAAAVMRALK